MSVVAWARTKDRDSFLPIDYSIDIKVLWCILSWVLPFQSGLNLLVKFIFIHRNEHERKRLKLPCWTVDWRCSVRFCRFDSRTSTELAIKLNNAWNGVILESTRSGYGPERHNYQLSPHTDAPVSHLRFYNGNVKAQQADLIKLNLRGRMVNRFNVHITENIVERKEKKGEQPWESGM
jgi:hypothetical protein